MKIIVDGSKIIQVSRDTEEVPNCIQVSDNEDLIMHLDKYIYENGQIILKPYIEIVSDKIVQGENKYSTSISGVHNLSITIKNTDGTTNTQFNDTLVLTQNLGGFTKNSNINFINGISNYSVSYDFPCFVMVRVNSENFYCSPVYLEFV